MAAQYGDSNKSRRRGLFLAQILNETCKCFIKKRQIKTSWDLLFNEQDVAAQNGYSKLGIYIVEVLLTKYCAIYYQTISAKNEPINWSVIDWQWDMAAQNGDSKVSNIYIIWKCLDF